MPNKSTCRRKGADVAAGAIHTAENGTAKVCSQQCSVRGAGPPRAANRETDSRRLAGHLIARIQRDAGARATLRSQGRPLLPFNISPTTAEPSKCLCAACAHGSGKRGGRGEVDRSGGRPHAARCRPRSPQPAHAACMHACTCACMQAACACMPSCRAQCAAHMRLSLLQDDKKKAGTGDV
eukprot:355964-Chlamydomonas_euryale.AAC.2